MESSPSPRPSPKRVTRDLSPADSDGYNSGEDKSERPIGRGQAKLHPQPLLPSPVCPPPPDSRDILSERTHPYLNGNASLPYCTAMINNFKFYFSLVLIHLNFLSFGCMHSNKGNQIIFAFRFKGNHIKGLLYMIFCCYIEDCKCLLSRASSVSPGVALRGRLLLL